MDVERKVSVPEIDPQYRKTESKCLKTGTDVRFMINPSEVRMTLDFLPE